jgi:glycosyltransferase involved in cell wall biosynthesis
MSKNSTKVDVVVPNYNKEEYIKECLNSLVRQTYSNWRCIVVDGYSNDGSWGIIKKFASDDERFELYRLDRIGLYKSWNWGLEKVRSPYFAILTSDDVWDRRWLETAVKTLETTDEAICAAARTRVIDSTSEHHEIDELSQWGEQILRMGELSNVHVWDGVKCSIASYFMESIFPSIHSLVMRSEILENQSFATDVGTQADVEWCIGMSLHGDIIYVPYIESYLRRYKGQASRHNLSDRSEMGNNALKITERMRNKILSSIKNDTEKKFAKKSEVYRKKILDYFYERPMLKSAFEEPKKTLLGVSNTIYKYPNLFLRDIISLIFGNTRYTTQMRSKMAEYVIYGKI